MKEEVIRNGQAIKFSNALCELLQDGFKLFYHYLETEVEIEKVAYTGEDGDFIILYPTPFYRALNYGTAGLSPRGGHSLRIEFPARPEEDDEEQIGKD